MGTEGYGDGSDRGMAEMAARVTDASSSWTGSVVYPPPLWQEMLQPGDGGSYEKVVSSDGGDPYRQVQVTSVC